MKYTEGRNILKGYIGEARNGATLTITEEDDGIHVTGTTGNASNKTVYVIPQALVSSNIVNYIHQEAVGMPLSVYIKVTNNGTKNVTVRLNGVDSSLTTIPAGETVTISKTGNYQGYSNIQIVLSVFDIGDTLNVVHDTTVYAGFGSIPDVISLAPERLTSAGRSISGDSITKA